MGEIVENDSFIVGNARYSVVLESATNKKGIPGYYVSIQRNSYYVSNKFYPTFKEGITEYYGTIKGLKNDNR